MRVLIVYGTTEGHTRELCNFAAGVLRERGCRVTTEGAGADPSHPDPAAYDAILLAASLHVGRYQAPLVHYAQVHHARLNAMPSAFLSVSLSAAGESPEDWAGVEECLSTFEAETGWTPGRVHQAAGAIRYSQYDFFKRLALQAIARRRGLKTARSQDYDLTDYDALRAFVTGFADAAAPSPGPG